MGDLARQVRCESHLDGPEVLPELPEAAVGCRDLADVRNAVAVSGWTQADLLINTLKQASASEDGLTRLSVMEAAREQDYASPMLINGIKWFSTPELLTGIDGFRPIKWNAGEKRFEPAGEVISIRP